MPMPKMSKRKMRQRSARNKVELLDEIKRQTITNVPESHHFARFNY